MSSLQSNGIKEEKEVLVPSCLSTLSSRPTVSNLYARMGLEYVVAGSLGPFPVGSPARELEGWLKYTAEDHVDHSDQSIDFMKSIMAEETFDHAITSFTDYHGPLIWGRDPAARSRLLKPDPKPGSPYPMDLFWDNAKDREMIRLLLRHLIIKNAWARFSRLPHRQTPVKADPAVQKSVEAREAESDPEDDEPLLRCRSKAASSSYRAPEARMYATQPTPQPNRESFGPQSPRSLSAKRKERVASDLREDLNPEKRPRTDKWEYLEPQQEPQSEDDLQDALQQGTVDSRAQGPRSIHELEPEEMEADENASPGPVQESAQHSIGRGRVLCDTSSRSSDSGNDHFIPRPPSPHTDISNTPANEERTEREKRYLLFQLLLTHLGTTEAKANVDDLLLEFWSSDKEHIKSKLPDWFTTLHTSFQSWMHLRSHLHTFQTSVRYTGSFQDWPKHLRSLRLADKPTAYIAYNVMRRRVGPVEHKWMFTHPTVAEDLAELFQQLTMLDGSPWHHELGAIKGYNSFLFEWFKPE
ncbi:hypothetical protein K458DRAFT_485842 [Lentithecium fluviatile CBS 122367]|uniref:Uncharacterized protein n=1 Tax=Lentithecium fluviatile CBS 122367 TaxID=1168545 RepID=A0A6G1J8T3_9PLEO|nr:hypothetical protein K458DRAFT_485842 [Lentithecium fluviatile CBS 122367]